MPGVDLCGRKIAPLRRKGKEMTEQIWHFIVLAATTEALWVAVIDGLFFAAWYWVFISDGSMDDPEALLIAFLTFAVIGFCMLLTFIWRGLPLVIAVFWIGLFVFLFGRVIKERFQARKNPVLPSKV